MPHEGIRAAAELYTISNTSLNPNNFYCIKNPSAGLADGFKHYSVLYQRIRVIEPYFWNSPSPLSIPCHILLSMKIPLAFQT